MRNLPLLILSISIFAFSNSNAQIVISKPNLGFSQACASSGFNNYNLSFTFSPDNGLSGSNQFILELSDADGDFDDPTIIHTTNPGEITSSPANIGFSFPTSIAGEAYKIRIKSTAPVATSTKSDAFAAYYKTQDSPFTINNLIGAAAFCEGGSYELTIDNPGTGSNDSPLNYPNLTFNWFRQITETTSEFVLTANSLTVTEPGTYYAETNYGSCTSDSFSNRVTVSMASSTSESSINSSLGNPYCPDGGPTTLTTISGEGYEWFKDGVAIPDSNVQSITTEESGEYSVNINLGSCNTSAKINLQSEIFSTEIDVPEVAFLEENETLMVTVTTDANSPLIIWFKDDVMINEVSSATYEVSETGNYKVQVSQTQGCEAKKEIFFRIASASEVVEIPNVISPNGDGVNDTWIIPQQFTNGGNTNITIYNSQGKQVFATDNYQNNWPQEPINVQDINPVFYYIISSQESEQRKGSITVIK